MNRLSPSRRPGLLFVCFTVASVGAAVGTAPQAPAAGMDAGIAPDFHLPTAAGPTSGAEVGAGFGGSVGAPGRTGISGLSEANPRAEARQEAGIVATASDTGGGVTSSQSGFAAGTVTNPATSDEGARAPTPGTSTDEAGEPLTGHDGIRPNPSDSRGAGLSGNAGTSGAVGGSPKTTGGL